MTIGRIHGLPFGVSGMGRPNHRCDELDLGPSAFTILFKLMQRSLRNRRERMALASLSDHLLRDIGLSRTAAAWSPEIRNRLP
jgi:uncharacterized protein YjiS (DUF1127 family)